MQQVGVLNSLIMLSLLSKLKLNNQEVNHLNTKSIAVLSTGHLHPLEVELLSQVSLVHGYMEGYLIDINDGVINDCKKLNLLCLVELLIELKDKYKVGYVLFDSQEPVVNEFKVYDW